jgi:methylated-DNA-[protein]-cysteine S-methyltransferase
MNTRHAVVSTVMGELTLVAAGDAVTGVYFPRHWTNPPRETFGVRVEPAGDALLELAGSQLVEYLDGRRTTFDLPTAATGDPFQQRVWALLAQIPTGRTATYGDLAEQLGDRRLARSVGQAVGHNPLSIIVPCHRVVGNTGQLTGYAGGLARKRFLLDLEAGIESLVTGCPTM